jgi:DNA adenine methylase
MEARPFLKWVGGKTQILPDLLKRVPKHFRTYREPFVGAGALYFALRHRNAVLSDLNRELVATYVAVRDHVDDVIERLESLAHRHSPELFATLRAKAPFRGFPFDTAARMIYLNKTCFNGVFRVNSKGLFNTPIGKFKTPPTICDAENLRACSEALQRAEIIAVDFREALRVVDPGDFVYCDPPYLPRSETADFTAFTAAGFGQADQEALAARARELKALGVHVLLSNAGNDKAKDLYKGFTVESVYARRSINSDGDKRGVVREYLIT